MIDPIALNINLTINLTPIIVLILLYLIGLTRIKKKKGD